MLRLELKANANKTLAEVGSTAINIPNVIATLRSERRE